MKRFGLSAVVVLFVLLLANLICFADSPSMSLNGWMGFDMGDTRLSQQPELWCVADSISFRTQEYNIRAGYQQYTVFAVVRNPDPDSVQWLWSFADNDTLTEAVHTAGIYSGRGGMLYAHTPRDFSRWSIYGYHSGCYSDSTKQRRLSIGSIGTFVTDSVIPDTICTNMEMKEWVYFPSLLGRRESDMFMTYLALKYGITLDYAPYLSCYGDTLWHPKRDEAYYHHIIGIGNDTAHLWSASQSASSDSSVLTLSTDTLCVGEYVLLGDDGGSLYGSLQADGSRHIECEWLLRPYLQRTKSLSLLLDISALPDGGYDLLWVTVTDLNGLVLDTLQQHWPESDSLLCFTLPEVKDTPLLLSLWGAKAPQKQKQKHTDDTQADSRVWYNAYDRTIEVCGDRRDHPLTVVLYDSAGKLMGTMTMRVPIPVNTLPGNACHVEILDGCEIVGSLTLPFNM